MRVRRSFDGGPVRERVQSSLHHAPDGEKRACPLQAAGGRRSEGGDNFQFS